MAGVRVSWPERSTRPVMWLVPHFLGLEVAGAAVQWLRDGLGIIQRSDQVEKLAATVADSDGVYFVPAFTEAPE